MRLVATLVIGSLIALGLFVTWVLVRSTDDVWTDDDDEAGA